MTRIWWEQIQAVIRLEAKKTFFARRSLWIYVLALLPVLLFGADAFLASREREETRRIAGEGEKRLVQMELADGKVTSVETRNHTTLSEDSLVFAGVFQFFYLRLAIFFGCLGVFMNLFRGEILDKSLHFYFLAPIRREVLVIGKFLAGLLATCVVFVGSVLFQIAIFTYRFGPGERELYLYYNHGLAHAAAYLGVTALACLGYGAFFLAAGMLFRSPIRPAAAILIWEAINPFLPPLLKKFSVIYYLKSLCPVDISTPPDAPPLLSLLVSNPDPVSAPVAIFGVISVALILLCLSSLQARRMEINYTSE